VYRADDWNWLLAKMEKNIGLWCNRWLSLGGRYILLKSVLESQPIYWMSMETIPRSVLNKIQKLMFNFLWSGHKETQHYHLCRWDLLSRPKKCGGWGFHNLFHFNTSLTINPKVGVTTTREKNITHTQHSPTCCFLCIQGVTGLHSKKSRATMPMDPLHQENFSVLTDFVNESATFFKVSTFISDTLFSSIMSLTK
jgi:hypothetical protein